MKLTLELSSSRLIESAGFALPISSLVHSYGEGSRIEVHVVRDGATVTPTELEQFVWVVKPVGFFKEEKILAGVSSFSWDSEIERWVGECNYNVAALTAQLYQTCEGMDETDHLDLWAQLGWRMTSSSSWQRSQVIRQFRLENALWKGDETFPTTGSPIESPAGAFLRPLIRSMSADVVNATTSYADVTDLKFPVEAGRRYWFRFAIPWSSSGTGNGAAWAVNGPTKSQLNLMSRWTNTATTSNERYTDSYDAGGAAGTNSSANGNFCIMEGTITVTATGFVTARFKSEAASGASITALPGGSVQYAELSA